MDRKDADDRRWTLWSIAVGKEPIFLAIFGVALIGGLSLVSWCKLSTCSTWASNIVSITQDFSAMVLGVLSIAYLTIEGATMLARQYDIHLREKDREEGRKEERREIKARLSEWDVRRRAAEIKGERFDEPLPLLDQDDD